jgi:poly-gamma-glutamate synthesis protein (capsule biosynthesis protein)
VTRVIKGLRVSFLAYSMRPVAAPPPARSYALATEPEILADVARLRPQTDCLVVSLHWGEEFVARPSVSEVAFAHALVDAGASVLLGHHPHVARPLERYCDAVIAYSLGNFAADMIWYDPLRNGLMLDCLLTRDGVERASTHAVRIDKSYLPAVQGADVAPGQSQVGPGLAREDYIREARSTVQAQRRALYRYTVRNAWRSDPAALLDLAATTIRGKLAGLARGRRDEIWG